MPAPFILFLLSCAAIAFLIAHKHFELEGRVSILHRIRVRGDALLHGHWGVLKNYLPVMEKGTVKAFFKIFLLSVFEAVLYAKRSFEKALKSFYHSLDSASVLKNKGQASFFLKNVVDHKEGLRRGS